MFLLHPSTFTLIPTSHHLSRPRMILETSPASWTSLEGLSSLLPTSEFSYWSLVSPFSSNLKLCVFSPPLLKPSVLSVRGQFFNASFLSSAAPTSFALILRLCPSPHHTSKPHTNHIPASLKVTYLAFFFVSKLHLFNFSRPYSSLFPPGAGSLTLRRYHDRQQFHLCFLSALPVITHSHWRW